MSQGETLLRVVQALAQPITGAPTDHDALMQAIGEAQVVLIGEASHGTHEFYRERARITQRLITEKGFIAVVVEADWPDAQRVNRFVWGEGEDQTAEQALKDFQRFPRWMWRNQDVKTFVGWLRDHNLKNPAKKAGFYGMDLYSLYPSLNSVVAYLERVSPQAAQWVREQYRCFASYAEDPQAYGMAAASTTSKSCEDAARAVLAELQKLENTLSGAPAREEHFHAVQNARVVLNAGRYYREMYQGQDTWNLRDRHMADTIDHLLAHQKKQGVKGKVVVWAHNSHVGDARATEVHWQQGQENVGQYLRERHPGSTYTIGFSTYTGEVTASDDWDAPAKRKQVRPALSGSWEELMHQTGMPTFWLDLRKAGKASTGFLAPRLERFIGVIYRPETERQSHYYLTRLVGQYDSLIHFDRTHPVMPLDLNDSWVKNDGLKTEPTRP